MRQVLSGTGQDTTALVSTWLQSGASIYLAHLYMIGEPDDPDCLMLTDWQSPLYWGLYGEFTPANIERDVIKSSIGFEVSKIQLSWRPSMPTATVSMATANAYQKAHIGVYDNWPVRIWICYMPTPGDAQTYGACERFGGRVGNVDVVRGEIVFEVTSFLDVVNKKVPAQVVELTNPAIATIAATPPEDLTVIPQFNVITGSTTGALIVDCTTPSAHKIFTDGILRNGYVVFNRGTGMTLGGRWSAILYNKKVTIASVDYNEITLCEALPWAPTPGVDTCYISGAAPINLVDGSYQGFPYVPSAEQAL
jgi:hypothetical protein